MECEICSTDEATTKSNGVSVCEWCSKAAKETRRIAIEEGIIEETTQDRLEYLRGEIEAERISYGEVAELESLSDHIDPDDVVLLLWAGVSEEERERRKNR